MPRDEIEARELATERLDVEGRCGGACANALIGRSECLRQVVIDAPPLRARGEERRIGPATERIASVRGHCRAAPRAFRTRPPRTPPRGHRTAGRAAAARW